MQQSPLIVFFVTELLPFFLKFHQFCAVNEEKGEGGKQNTQHYPFNFHFP